MKYACLNLGFWFFLITVSMGQEKAVNKDALQKAERYYTLSLKLLKTNPENGIGLLKEARNIFRNHNLHEKETNAILALAEIYIRLSDYDVAYSLLTNASSLSLDHGLTDQQMMALISLGRLSSYLGDYGRSGSYFSDANKLAGETGQARHQLLARAYQAYINLYYLHDLADSNYVRIRDLHQLVSRPPVDTLMMQVSTNLMAGACNLILQDQAKAARYYQQSILLARLVGDRYRESLVSNNLAEMQIQAGDFINAEKTLMSSMKIAREIHSKLLIYNCFRWLSRCAESRGDFQTALAYYKSFEELKSEVLDENLIRKTQQSHSLYQLERKAREAERISSEKALAEIESEKLTRTFLATFLVIGLIVLFLGVFAFTNRRRLQQFRLQNQVIEEQNLILQNLNRDLLAQRKSAEDANREAELAIQSKIDFLSIMTHEIRTPINAVIGTVQLLQEENPPAYQHRSLEILRFSAENLLNLVNDILDFNKIEAGKIELESKPFSLRLLLQNIKNSLQFKADEKGLDLRLRLDKDLPHAFIGDKLRLGQVFYNLVSNALKFTGKGFVEIEIRYYPGDKEGNLFASIRDSGIGIEPDKQDTIFDFFSQAEPGISRKFGGSGLGLTITKNLLHLMGTRIELESKPGEGSCFSFSLQLLETNPGFLEEMEFQEIEGTLDLSGSQILFVEDVEFNQVIAERFFNKWNIRFDTAGTSSQAVTLASNQEYDLILMDLLLPDSDGFETVRIIRSGSINRKTPVLAMTASGYYEIRDKLQENAIEGYISKPFVSQDLRNAIALWIGKKGSATNGKIS